jgi:hypothetical protein
VAAVSPRQPASRSCAWAHKQQQQSLQQQQQSQQLAVLSNGCGGVTCGSCLWGVALLCTAPHNMLRMRWFGRQSQLRSCACGDSSSSSTTGSSSCWLVGQVYYVLGCSSTQAGSCL